MTSTTPSSRPLVIYFSRPGMNYVAGSIIDLAEGNTKLLAQEIARRTQGDLYEIEPVAPYPFAYRETTDLAQKEIDEDARPAMKSPAPDISGYQEIYLGYPIWWGLAPRIVLTLIEALDWKDKTVHLFCTHEGSGISQSASELKAMLKGARTLTGPVLAGSRIAERGTAVSDYLASIGR